MSINIKDSISFIPFDNIALTFSGGGFRAAAYSLGALSYLNCLKIDKADQPGDFSVLENVSYISSTSGGSFTNALYSAYIHNGKTFEDVYKKLIKDMSGQDLLQQVFIILNDDKQWNDIEGKQRNIINAFAKTYDKIIFEGETFGAFWNKKYIPKFEVCFNCTEFYRGLSFRFQTEGDNKSQQVIGNKYLHFSTQQIDTVKKIKLADMVAASSCFPAGFEPIIYPQDFSYSKDGAQLGIEELRKAMLYENYQENVSSIENSYGFMDGGITDNQGLYSAMLADKKRRRRTTPNPFDLIIVTDVTSYFMDEYKQPITMVKPEWRINNPAYYLNKAKAIIKNLIIAINWSPVILMLTLFAGIGMTIFSDSKGLIITGSFIGGGSIVAILSIYGVKQISLVKWLWKNKKDIAQDEYLNHLTKNNKLFSENVMIGIIQFLKVTKIGFLEQIVKARIMSLLSLVLDINLKQTRRLIYEMFYNEPMWENRRIPNFIYELSTYNKTSRVNRFNSKERLKWIATAADKNLLLDNCEALNVIAEDARTMGTTLWFDKNDTEKQKLKKIVAAGQFTTCCNLLEYVISLERKGIQFEEDINSRLNDLKIKLTKDFTLFKESPFFLFDILETTL
jgi:predicted acylesterase/phospholipase RssA